MGDLRSQPLSGCGAQPVRKGTPPAPQPGSTLSTGDRGSANSREMFQTSPSTRAAPPSVLESSVATPGAFLPRSTGTRTVPDLVALVGGLRA